MVGSGVATTVLDGSIALLGVTLAPTISVESTFLMFPLLFVYLSVFISAQRWMVSVLAASGWCCVPVSL